MPSRLRRHDEYGHVHFLTISCHRRLQFFRHDSVKKSFIDGMRHVREKLGVRWIGFVIMPEHVHLLVFPHQASSLNPVPISSILQHLKQYVGRYGKAALRDVWRARRGLGTGALDMWATSDGAKPFWKTRAYDFNVVSELALHTKLDYMHKNPITRGIVDRAEDWVWSSYRYYEIGDDSLIEMDWDGRWPIVSSVRPPPFAAAKDGAPAGDWKHETGDQEQQGLLQRVERRAYARPSPTLRCGEGWGTQSDVKRLQNEDA